VKYAFIKEHQRRWPVNVQCRVLEVARSGYYAWKRGTIAPRMVWRHRVLREIRRSFLESRRTYGSPRIHQELVVRGCSCCVNTVARLMKKERIQAQTRRKYRVQTTDSKHLYPVAANLLGQRFSQSRANRAWAADITFVPTQEGWLYVAVILDLFSRRVVGWAMADHLKALLVREALEMAMVQRRPEPGLLIHSDRGVQYACHDYQGLLRRHQLVCSMSRSGNCYDNAVVESFYGTMKREWVHRQHYRTRQEARVSIFEFIEVFYNRQRRHSALRYVSPVAFEALHEHA